MKNQEPNEYIKQIQIQRIKDCMKEFNIKNKYIAEKLNYTPQHISYVLNGKRTLTKEMAIDLADIFSECAGGFIHKVQMPYSELPDDEKGDYNQEDIEDGFINVFFEEPASIDYRYLLGEMDDKNVFDSYGKSTEQTTSYLYTNGIQSMLHFYGYDMKINKCPDVTVLRSLNPNSCLIKLMKDNYLNPNFKNEIIRISDGEKLQLLPAEMYHLFQDLIKSMLCIVERRFDQQKWFDTLHSAGQDIPPKGELPFESDSFI